MSSISRAGIFIDIKALLEYTDRMVGEMTIADAIHRKNIIKDYTNYKIIAV